MKEIIYIVGDATTPIGNGIKIIAHICNDVGCWGSGFVIAISKKWSCPEKKYRKWYYDRERNPFVLGKVCLVKVENDIFVANMIGQRGITYKPHSSPPIRYEAVRDCLNILRSHAQSLNATIHMPRIGCGLAGGRWDMIEPIIQEELSNHNISVTIYDLPQ